MRKGAFLMLAALALSGIFAAARAEEAVVTLTTGNFEDVVKSNDFIVVMFYAPWCGHCKRLSPEYEKAAKTFAELESPKVALGKVDATQESDLASRFAVRGYPTLKIFRAGDLEKPTEYEGPRDADGIISYLKKQAGPAVSKHSNKKEIEAALKDLDVAVVAALASDSDALKTLTAVAESMRSEMDFLYVESEKELPGSVCKHSPGSCKAAPSIVVVKEYDEPVVAFQGDATDESAVKEFVAASTRPSIVMLSRDNKYRRFLEATFGRQSKKLLALDKASAWKGRDSAIAGALRTLQDKFVDEVQAGEIDFLGVDTDENAAAMEYFGLKKEDLPAMVIHDVKKDAKFVEKQADLGKASKWVDEVLSGKINRYLKSEEIPADNDGEVKVVVAKQFDEIVFESGKTVLIQFYAPWCGHCKKLKPVYEDVGEFFEKNDSITVAKMDATANDIPSDKFPVKGFPTIFLYVPSTGDAIEYKGDRSKDDLIKFVSLNQKAANDAVEADDDEQPDEESQAPDESHEEL